MVNLSLKRTLPSLGMELNLTNLQGSQLQKLLKKRIFGINMLKHLKADLSFVE